MIKRKLLSIIALCFLLMPLISACGQEGQSPPDINIAHLRSTTNLFSKAEIIHYTHSDHENGYEAEYRSLSGEELVTKFNEDLVNRIGGMIRSPMDVEPSSPMRGYYGVASMVSQTPGVECYVVMMKELCASANYKDYRETNMCFIIQGDEMLESVYVQVGSNFMWYSFKNPEKFLNTYWNLAVPSK